MHCVTPVEPLLQCVTHTMFYQSNMLPVVPKFILRAESIQVKYTLTPPPRRRDRADCLLFALIPISVSHQQAAHFNFNLFVLKYIQIST